MHVNIQIDTRQDGSMPSCVYTKFWSYDSNAAAEIENHQTRQPFSHLLLVSLCELLQFPVLSWQDWHPVWSSAAVTHLLQGSTCCAIRDALLHTLLVTSDCLSYCCHSISSSQSGHSPLTSGIDKAFSPTELLLTVYFIFLRSILCKP